MSRQPKAMALRSESLRNESQLAVGNRFRLWRFRWRRATRRHDGVLQRRYSALQCCDVVAVLHGRFFVILVSPRTSRRARRVISCLRRAPMFGMYIPAWLAGF